MIETAAFFVAICNGPWFLKLYVVENDLQAFRSVFSLQDRFPKLGQALLKSMNPHTWYLTEQLVMMALADQEVDEVTKQKMLDKLIFYKIPTTFKMG